MQLLINIEDDLWDNLVEKIHKEFLIENIYGFSPKQTEAEIKKRIKGKIKKCLVKNLLSDIERGWI
jgi:hypothetical protein